MSQLYEVEDTTLCRIYFDIIVPTVTIISLIMMVTAFYKYIKSDNIQNKCLFWTGLIFFIITFLSIIMIIIYSIYFCRDMDTFNLFFTIATQLYIIQSLLLLALLFARLYYVFEGTTFALSQTAVKLYWIFYSFVIIVFIGSGLAHVNLKDSITKLAIVGSAFSMAIIVMIILVSLFLYKMNQVYQHVNKEDDPELIKMITKTSILAAISGLATLLNAVGALHASLTNSIHFILLMRLVFVFDLVTNYWCIVLSYRGYNDWYLRLCGICDSVCTSCWHRIGRTTKRELSVETESRKSASIATK